MQSPILQKYIIIIHTHTHTFIYKYNEITTCTHLQVQRRPDTYIGAYLRMYITYIHSHLTYIQWWFFEYSRTRLDRRVSSRSIFGTACLSKNNRGQPTDDTDTPQNYTTQKQFRRKTPWVGLMPGEKHENRIFLLTTHMLLQSERDLFIIFPYTGRSISLNHAPPKKLNMASDHPNREAGYLTQRDFPHRLWSFRKTQALADALRQNTVLKKLSFLEFSLVVWMVNDKVIRDNNQWLNHY